ncbi:VWA domain-containing protein, partial [Candidatus Woesearchaeota archaeon]
MVGSLLKKCLVSAGLLLAAAGGALAERAVPRSEEALSSTSRQVQIVYPQDEYTIATRGVMPVHVKAAEGLDVLVSYETPSGRTPAFPRSNVEGGVERFWSVPVISDYSHVCVVAEALNKQGDVVGEDRACTLPFSKPAAESNPGFHVEVSAERKGSPLGGVPRGCTPKEANVVCDGKQWASRKNDLERIVQGSCVEQQDEKHQNEVVCQADLLQEEDIVSCKVGKTPCDVVGVDPAKPPGNVLVDVLIDRSSSVTRSEETNKELIKSVETLLDTLEKAGVKVLYRVATFAGGEQDSDAQLKFFKETFSGPEVVAQVLQNGMNPSGGRTLIYTALANSLDIIASEKKADEVYEALTGVGRERIMVLLTDCEDTSRMENKERFVNEALEQARRAGVPIYVVKLGGTGGQGDTVCRAFAKSTGGVYEQNPRKVGELIARIGQDM